jgi:hypothetical protein
LVNTKRRHVATAQYYKPLINYNWNVLFSIAIPFTAYRVISIPISMDISLSLIALRYIVAWIVVGFSAGKLKKMILNSGSR